MHLRKQVSEGWFQGARTRCVLNESIDVVGIGNRGLHAKGFSYWSAKPLRVRFCKCVLEGLESRGVSNVAKPRQDSKTGHQSTVEFEIWHALDGFQTGAQKSGQCPSRNTGKQTSPRPCSCVLSTLVL